MESLRLAIVGCGEMGALRARAIAHVPDCVLVAVADPRQARRTALARQHGAGEDDDWHRTVDREDVDAILVCTPPDSHAEVAVAALRAGKHVLCEKPLSRTTEECRAIVEAAEECDRVAATGFNFRFYPSIRRAHQLLDRGEIGSLDHVRALAGYSASDHDRDWLTRPDITGGGVLRDIGIHLIDTVRLFLGEITQVSGRATSFAWGFEGCEDNGFAVLENALGNVATLQASWSEWDRYRFRVGIYGRDGCLLVSCFPMTVRVYRRENGVIRRRIELFPWYNLRAKLQGYQWAMVDSLARELTALREAVTERGANAYGPHGRPLASAFDGMRAVQIAEAIGENG